MRILIADDDSVARKLIDSALTKEGHDVLSFDDGESLWEAYDEAPAPMIVTDWMMPRATGVEVCRRIRRQKSASYAHVVIVTSLSAAEHTIEAYKAGVDDFVGKPFSVDEISERVAAAARGILAQNEAALRRALELSQRALGHDHDGLLETLDELAKIARQQRSFARCRSFIRRQLGISVKSFGASDPRSERLARELDEMALLEDEVA